MAQGPCLNPNCNSNGRPHPNCKCYASMAEGGTVSCNGPHKSDCQYYMANGGQMPQSSQVVDQDPSETLGHAAIHGGLLGLLKNAGNSNLANFTSKHSKILQNLPPDLDKAADAVSGPLTGQITKDRLKPILQRLTPAMTMRDSNPEAFRSSVNYLHSSIRGDDKLKGYTKGLLGLEKEHSVNSDEKTRENLKDHLTSISANPDLALETGGNLSHYLPGHAAQLGALTGIASNYLNSIKPANIPGGPLDEAIFPSRVQEMNYHRQLDIAQQPLMALERVKDGTLLPQDVTTLSTIYPSLYRKMVSNIGEEVIAAKAKKIEVPYSRRLALSLFTGQPLDSSLSQSILMGAMIANAPKQTTQPQNKKKPPTKSAVSQQNKVSNMLETETQSREQKKD